MPFAAFQLGHYRNFRWKSKQLGTKGEGLLLWNQATIAFFATLPRILSGLTRMLQQYSRASWGRILFFKLRQLLAML